MFELCCLAIFIVIIVWIALALLPKQKVTVETKSNLKDRYCPNCGRNIPLNANVCPYCGRTFETTSIKSKYCHNCGAEIIEKNNYCPMCGKKVE